MLFRRDSLHRVHGWLGVALLSALIATACASDSEDAPSVDPGTSLAVSDDETVTIPARNLVDGTLTTSAPVSSATTTTTGAPTTTTTPPTTTPIPHTPLDSIPVELELVGSVNSPVGLTARPGSTDLFVVEQRGRIVRFPNGSASGADVTFDLRGSVSLGNEQGLLGATFSPDGDTLYVDYTNTDGDTVIARYAMAGPIADAESAEVLFTVDQPQGNHNGGQLAFGPDGFLYIGLGDGGGVGDPRDNGQNPDTRLGSILRIDVAADEGYGIPSDNPFPDGAAPEVFIWGVRNAWRFAFDQPTGDLWIADVGQDRFEEVNVLRNGDQAGANLGWNEIEGLEPYSGGTAPEGHVEPVIAYAQTNGRCSVTGGEVYRGTEIPRMEGTYLFGDFCTGEVFGYRIDESAEPVRLDLPAIDELTSFGVDAQGEPYVLSRAGGIFRIVSG